MTPFFRSVCLLIIKWRLPSSGDIQKRCCPCIDTHKLPLRLPVRLTHGHQKIHSLSDLLKVRESKGILMQMLQNTATFEETFERVLSNRKANGLSDKTLQTCNNR